MTLHWTSILPPLLAIVCAFLTKKIIPSLAIAVLAGGILTTKSFFSGILKAFSFVFSSATDPANFEILAFVILVMAMIAVVLVNGGLQGLVKWLGRFVKGRRSAKLVTVILGYAVFIDDYANTMIVGTAMRPVTDKFKVSREKLAFIVDATSAPVAGLMFLSTWIGYQVGLFTQVANSLGIQRDGYSMFFDSMPYRFFCILMIGFVFINVLTRRDYGSMFRAEKRALSGKGLLESGSEPMTSKSFTEIKPESHVKIVAKSALLPILGMFGALLVGLWIDGKGQNVFSLEAWRNALGSAQNGILILAVCAGFGLMLALLTSKLISKASNKALSGAVLKGIKGSLLPIVILILAWSLKASCDALHTGAYLSETIGQVVSPLWFPGLLFIVSGLTAFATGTSWGTMAILIPTAIPIAYQLDGSAYGLVTIISLGAILDGAIFGDHCSPISDTTIMSSIGSSCNHIDHVKTQIPYALTVGVLALVVGYVPAAMSFSALGSVVVGVGLIWVIFRIFGVSLVEK